MIKSHHHTRTELDGVNTNVFHRDGYLIELSFLQHFHVRFHSSSAFEVWPKHHLHWEAYPDCLHSALTAMAVPKEYVILTIFCCV